MLPCVNCKKDVPPDGGEFFLQVFVCGDCHRVARPLLERGEHDLRMLLIVLKEAIRQELIRGRCQLRTEASVEDMSKKDLVGHLADLAQRLREKEETCSTPTKTLSSATTLPSVPSASESRTSSSSSEPE